jgi:hypothetical protein
METDAGTVLKSQPRAAGFPGLSFPFHFYGTILQSRQHRQKAIRLPLVHRRRRETLGVGRRPGAEEDVARSELTDAGAAADRRVVDANLGVLLVIFLDAVAPGAFTRWPCDGGLRTTPRLRPADRRQKRFLPRMALPPCPFGAPLYYAARVHPNSLGNGPRFGGKTPAPAEWRSSTE